MSPGLWGSGWICLNFKDLRKLAKYSKSNEAIRLKGNEPISPLADSLLTVGDSLRRVNMVNLLKNLAGGLGFEPR